MCVCVKLYKVIFYSHSLNKKLVELSFVRTQQKQRPKKLITKVCLSYIAVSILLSIHTFNVLLLDENVNALLDDLDFWLESR